MGAAGIVLTAFHVPTSRGAVSGGAGAGFVSGTYTLATGLSTDHLPTLAEARRQVYVANGWDAVKVWDGIAANAVNAGIATAPQTWAPTVVDQLGSTSVGIHLVRYRYKNSKTGYVSDPSNEFEREAYAPFGKKWPFAIADSGVANIIRPTDTKVDQIVLEMTTVGGSTFFVAATVAKTATSVDANISDDDLAEAVLEWDDDGHGTPPYCRLLAAMKGRMFYAGRVVHNSGTCTVTSAATGVTLSTASLTDACVGLYFAVDGDTKNYAIASKTNASQFVLAENYTGTSGAGKSYSIFALEPNIVFWSLPAYPESVDPDNWALVLEDSGDTLSAMAGFEGGIVLFGQHTIDEFLFSDDPAEGHVRRCSGERGALNNECVVSAQNRLFVFDREGFYEWRCPLPVPIGVPVHELLGSVNWAQKSKFFGAYSAQEQVVRWWYCSGSDTEPKNYFEYDLEVGTWTTGRTAFGVRSATGVATPSGRRRLLLGDENGYTWYADISTADGANPTAIVKSTVAAGSSTTVVNVVDGGLDTAGDGLKGVEAYWKEGNQSRIIASNTTTAFTVSAAFSGTPAVGNTIYIGRTAAKLKTKAIVLRQLSNRQEAIWLHLFFVPQASARELIVRVYENYSASAKSDFVAKNERDVQYTASSSDIKVSLNAATGHVRVPLGQAANRVIQIELIVNEPATALRLLGMQIAGQEIEAQD